MDATLGVLYSFVIVRVQLIEELERVKDLARSSARDTRMPKATLKPLKSSVDINSIRMLTTTVSLLETEVLDLQDLVKGSGEIMLKIVTGKISITGHPSGHTGGDSRDSRG